VNTGEKKCILNVGYDYCASLAFSPDGKMLAGGSDCKTLFLWDMSNQKEIARITTNDGTNGAATNVSSAVVFNPDGKTILAWNCDDHGDMQSIKYWDVAAQKNTSTVQLKPRKYAWMRFSSDSKIIAGVPDGDRMNHKIDFIDTASGKILVRLDGGDSLNEMAFSPDGKKFAAGITFILLEVAKTEKDVDVLHGLKIWDVKTGNKILTLNGFEDSIFALAFSSDGKILATGGLGNPIIKFWNVSTKGNIGQNISALMNPKHYTDGISCISFSPNGQLLAAARTDGTIEIWDIQALGINEKSLSSTDNALDKTNAKQTEK